MKNHLKLATSLHEVPFFRSLSPAAFARVEDFVYHREYEPRQIVYFPDDLCDHLYWVREGRVKVTLESQDRRELTLRHLFPGDIFGEECVIESGRRGVYAEAMTHTILCLMRADDVRRIARESSEVCYLLSQRLCARIIESDRVLAQTVFQSVRSRVACGLLRLHKKVAKDGPVAITHQELANLVGSTRETTTVVLHELREEGIVSTANRRIKILDPIALEHAARSD